MTAPTLDLPAITTNTPGFWPPLCQDVYADRHGTHWTADMYDDGDTTHCQMVTSGGRRADPDYLLETTGPLRLVVAGWERVRDQRATAVAA